MRRCALAVGFLCPMMLAAQPPGSTPPKAPDLNRMGQIIQDSVKEKHLMGTVLVERDLRVLDAEIEFFPDANGKVDHLVLYQGGHEIKGVKE